MFLTRLTSKKKQNQYHNRNLVKSYSFLGVFRLPLSACIDILL
jgi:hypothetical protein